MPPPLALPAQRDAEEQFMQLRSAYDTLSDARARRDYDSALERVSAPLASWGQRVCEGQWGRREGQRGGPVIPGKRQRQGWPGCGWAGEGAEGVPEVGRRQGERGAVAAASFPHVGAHGALLVLNSAHLARSFALCTVHACAPRAVVVGVWRTAAAMKHAAASAPAPPTPTPSPTPPAPLAPLNAHVAARARRSA